MTTASSAPRTTRPQNAVPTPEPDEAIPVRLDSVDRSVEKALPGAEESLRKKEEREAALAGMGKKRAKRMRFTAANADRHELYQLSVQSPEEDAAFLARVYKKNRGRPARHFREDFCGTGVLSSHWLKRNKENTAEGYDIDPDPLAWGIVHNFRPLGEGAGRMLMRQRDVRESSERPPDVRCAQNFSYWIFDTRRELLEYFMRVRDDLADDGVFVVDVHGGPEAIEEMEEERPIEDGFTYVWDQDEFWPITGKCKCKIHFRFKDGTELTNAFTYGWRFWGLTELRDVLEDAGFERVDCYWEGTDEDGESGNGIFRKATKGENCLSYIAYLVAVK